MPNGTESVCGSKVRQLGGREWVTEGARQREIQTERETEREGVCERERE